MLFTGELDGFEFDSVSLDAPDVFATAGGVLVEFEQEVQNTESGQVSFEQSVGVTFSGNVIEILQNVQLRSSSGGLGTVAVEFQQSVVKTVSGNVAQFMQMVVDDA